MTKPAECPEPRKRASMKMRQAENALLDAIDEEMTVETYGTGLEKLTIALNNLMAVRRTYEDDMCYTPEDGYNDR
jgi:hypothetical protein